MITGSILPDSSLGIVGERRMTWGGHGKKDTASSIFKVSFCSAPASSPKQRMYPSTRAGAEPASVHSGHLHMASLSGQRAQSGQGTHQPSPALERRAVKPDIGVPSIHTSLKLSEKVVGIPV